MFSCSVSILYSRDKRDCNHFTITVIQNCSLTQLFLQYMKYIITVHVSQFLSLCLFPPLHVSWLQSSFLNDFSDVAPFCTNHPPFLCLSLRQVCSLNYCNQASYVLKSGFSYIARKFHCNVA